VITLSKIRGFHTVATLGSFRQAAKELGRTQPALTAQVADLERDLGVSLLERTTRRTRLTPEGREFLNRTRHAVAEIDAAVAEIREQVTLRRGRVSMGCIPTVAAFLIPDVLAEFSRRYPAIVIRYFDEPTLSLVGRLKLREIDFFVGPAPRTEPDIDFKHLYLDHFVVVFPRDHPFSGRKSVRLEECLAQPQVGMASGMNVRTVLDEYFAQHGLDYAPLLEAEHHFTLGGMVQTGFGITLLPMRAVPLLSHPGLEWCEIADQKIFRDIGICTYRSARLTPPAKIFVEMIEPALLAHSDTTP
jgi:LysR family transcriptional regulator, carnitine catabolism transcriptional activator